jgi:aspartyl-tRNA(Asn)/glutamyl-tRNA(Gln) amidotransferase subunit A
MSSISSAREQLERCLEAERAWNPHVNGVIASLADPARAEADAADKAAREGRWLGLLHGMPIAIKDNIDTAGVPATAGSLFFKDRVPNRDAPVVARLRRAGAVINSKVTMHEVAFGIRSWNPIIGPSRNPYDLTRVPGGSSGGSGIAVATGMCQAALGTDTGGSVRLPAAICGITGLRPTLGRVPNTGCLPVSAGHDTIGPMARTAADCARLFAVLAGYDADDPVSENRPLENFLPSLSDGIAGVRVGIPKNFYLEGCSSEVAAAYQDAVRVLEKLGARLVEVSVPGADAIHAHASCVIYCDACALHADRLDDETGWGPMTLERMRTGLGYTGVDYARAMRVKESWKRTLSAVFEAVDILASPTIGDEPPPVDDKRPLLEATSAVTKTSYAGAFGSLPGLSVPCGQTRRGLPLGLMLEAAWWQEPLLLRAGHAYQQVTDWHDRRPVLPGRSAAASQGAA